MVAALKGFVYSCRPLIDAGTRPGLRYNAYGRRPPLRSVCAKPCADSRASIDTSQSPFPGVAFVVHSWNAKRCRRYRPRCDFRIARRLTFAWLLRTGATYLAFAIECRRTYLYCYAWRRHLLRVDCVLVVRFSWHNKATCGCSRGRVGVAARFVRRALPNRVWPPLMPRVTIAST